MLRPILAVIGGYFAMAVVVMITMSLLWVVTGPDFAFEEGTTKATVGWSVVALLLGGAAAVVGGCAARAIARNTTAPKVLAGIVLLLGLVMAVGHLDVDDPSGTEALAERSIAEMSMFEAASETVAPTWYNFLIPFVGAAGVLVGARRRTDGGG